MIHHDERDPQFSRDFGYTFDWLAIPNDEATALLAKGSIDLANALPNKVHAPISSKGFALTAL
jgi:hypothetical protein